MTENAKKAKDESKAEKGKPYSAWYKELNGEVHCLNCGAEPPYKRSGYIWYSPYCPNCGFETSKVI